MNNTTKNKQDPSRFSPAWVRWERAAPRTPTGIWEQLICRCELQLGPLCYQLQPEPSTEPPLLENREWKIGFMPPTRFPLGQKGRESSYVRGHVWVSKVWPQQCSVQFTWRWQRGEDCWVFFRLSVIYVTLHLKLCFHKIWKSNKVIIIVLYCVGLMCY